MRSLHPPHPAPRRTTPGPWHKVTLTDLTEAEGLLDWLENAG